MDILGNTRNASSDSEILSSEYTRLIIGSAVSLCQGFTGNYEQSVSPVFEIGSPELRWIKGFPSGSATVSNVVGRNGFFKSFGGNNCGVISTMSLTTNPGGCASFEGSGQSSLRFKNAVIANFGFKITAGQAAIGSDVTFKFATLEEN